MFTIEEGDFIQARKYDGDNVAVAEFVVTGIDGTKHAGSPLGPLDGQDGWTFELIRKGDPALPGTLSDLAVWLTTDQSVATRIVGPVAGAWHTPEGSPVSPEDVLAWMPWSEHENASGD